MRPSVKVSPRCGPDARSVALFEDERSGSADEPAGATPEARAAGCRCDRTAQGRPELLLARARHRDVDRYSGRLDLRVDERLHLRDVLLGQVREALLVLHVLAHRFVLARLVLVLVLAVLPLVERPHAGLDREAGHL